MSNNVCDTKLLENQKLSKNRKTQYMPVNVSRDCKKMSERCLAICFLDVLY